MISDYLFDDQLFSFCRQICKLHRHACHLKAQPSFAALICGLDLSVSTWKVLGSVVLSEGLG